MCKVLAARKRVVRSVWVSSNLGHLEDRWWRPVWVSSNLGHLEDRWWGSWDLGLLLIDRMRRWCKKGSGEEEVLDDCTGSWATLKEVAMPRHLGDRGPWKAPTSSIFNGFLLRWMWLGLQNDGCSVKAQGSSSNKLGLVGALWVFFGTVQIHGNKMGFGLGRELGLGGDWMCVTVLVLG